MTPSIAYLTAAFPALSETFVYREVRALRSRGFRIEALTLRRASPPPAHSSDLTESLGVVYARSTFLSGLAEPLAHPLQSARTLVYAVIDAIFPGEETSPSDRLKTIAQACSAIVLAPTLRKRGVRHIHCHFAHAPASVGMYAALQLNIPFSFTGHANDIFEHHYLLKRKLQRATFVACISEWHREFYAKITDAIQGKAPVIRCGVDTDEWQPVPKNRLLGSKLKLVTVCRLVEKKGIHTLIEALSMMQRPASLSIAGDGPEREHLEALAKRLGCDDRIEWLGAIQNDASRELMQDADVFVLPCQQDRDGDRDGIPVVLIESMACGVPVICGDLPAIRELVVPDRTGILIPPGDAEALREQLESVTDQRLAELAACGRQRVEDEFSLETNVDRLEMLFQRSFG
jgi:colanic acid/amylovoran biosynthesis glycosyltransferase